MFIKIDYQMCFSSVCENENEVMESCGYDVDEMSFSEFLKEIKGEFEIIEIKGDIVYLN